MKLTRQKLSELVEKIAALNLAENMHTGIDRPKEIVRTVTEQSQPSGQGPGTSFVPFCRMIEWAPEEKMKFNEKQTAQVLKVLGETVRERRLDLRLSQKTLAEESGIHQTYLSELENGLRNPSVVVLLAISEGLQLTFDEFAEILAAGLKPRAARKATVSKTPKKSQRVLGARKAK
jgi:DNA-binding XRE family transcriptional regulator